MKNNRANDQDFRPDILTELPMTVARYAMIGGALLLAGSLAICLVLLNQAANLSQGPDAVKQAESIVRNFGTFEKGLLLGTFLAVVGSAYAFWEEEFMVAVHLVVGAALYFSPAWAPSLISGPTSQIPAYQTGLDTLQSAGKVYALLAICVLIGDIVTKVRQRAIQGAKLEQLKYGRGVKEERQNVFLGKCWQLPFCRQFVRERCPIFHAKRTCWRELVGCMCEESVIRTAMENKPVSKEALLSGAAIPRNNQLTVAAKRERCKNCVIYNEHQKHKYRALLPTVMIFWAGFYLVFRDTLERMIQGMIGRAGSTMSEVTAGAVRNINTGDFFVKFLVVCFILVALSYTLKMLEFVVFKLKL